MGRSKRAGSAVVVGGSAGIGLALAREFAGHGHAVTVLARDQGRLDEALRDLRAIPDVQVEGLSLDAVAAEAPARIAQIVAGAPPGPRHIVLAAAHWHAASVASTSDAEARRLAEVNVLAPLAICRAVLPHLRAGDGILVVGSLAAALPLPWMGLYGASKAHLHAAALGLRQEIAGSGIAVGVLAPGAVLTGFVPRQEDSRWRWLVDLAASTPETVAHAGYRGLLAGTALIVPGLLWRLGWLASRLVPTDVPMRLARLVLAPMARHGLVAGATEPKP